MVSFNQSTELLQQTTAENIISILNLAEHAYQADDYCVNKKLHSFLVKFSIATQTLARNLLYSPVTIAALLKLLTVPLWNTFLMDPKKLGWIAKSGWSDLVIVFTVHSQTPWWLTVGIIGSSRHV
jgi:hypothetical protein